MPGPIPIYRDHDETCAADTCLPLVEAARKNQVRMAALVHGHYPGKPLPHGALAGVKTVGFWDADTDQNWGLEWHRNEGLELTFLETGRMGFAVDKWEGTLKPDDLTITRPWQLHRVGNPNVPAGRLHYLILDVGVRRPNLAWKWPSWLLLSEPDVNELTTILRQNEQPVWKAPAEIRRCFQEVAQAVAGDRGGSNVSRLAVRLNDLFLLLLDMLRRKKVRLDETLWSSQRTVELFLADLRTHPEHLSVEWTVEEMATSCGLGATQFVHYVRRLTNMTPLHLLNHYRLDVAAERLRKERVENMTELALALGFSSGQYFATVFRRRYGYSPRDCRRGRVL